MLSLTFNEDIMLQTSDGPIFIRSDGRSIIIAAPIEINIKRSKVCEASVAQQMKDTLDGRIPYES